MPLSHPYILNMLRILLALFIAALAVPASATEAGWALLRDGEHVVLLRHAMAPGASEPSDFDIENCKTQRNLSERGRQQARKIGALFATRAAPTERVLTSRYCRTRETARLAFGDPEDFAPLDPPAADEAERATQLDQIRKEISGYSGKNSAELFAEAFAAIKYGDATRKSHPAVADLISVIAKYKAHKKGSKS